MAEVPELLGGIRNLPQEGKCAQQSPPDARWYRALIESSDALCETRNPQELLKEMAPRVLPATGAHFLSIAIHDPTQDCMVMHYWDASTNHGEYDAYAVDECAGGYVWREQQVWFTADAAHDNRFPGCMQALLRHEVRSYTTIPLGTKRQRCGAMGVGKAMVGEPTDADLEILTAAAHIAATVLEHQEQRNTVEEKQRRLQGLVSISESLNSSLEIETVIARALSELRGLMHCDHAALMTVEEEGKSLCKFALDSLFAGQLRAFDMQMVPIQQSLSRRAIETQRITIWRSEELDGSGLPAARNLRASGIQSLINVPLITDGKVWGTLNLGKTQQTPYHQTDLDYLQQIATQIAPVLRNARAYREIRELKDRLAGEKRYLESEVEQEGHREEIVGGSSILKRVLDYASIVAGTDSTVLITGETGTGKERVARLIHRLSQRAGRSFIKLNCAAIPTGLLESELFGHEKGAFTGAITQKIGRLELADKGTLFLDEIGDIPLELQPKLLRVLQDQEFERLGSTRTIKVDVRLIAATNRDLHRAVEEKQFRSDLFYRLHVFPLHLPALRERREDIPLLVRHFVERSCKRLNRRIEFISDGIIDAMLRWNWPGNIRELENFIERSVILSEGNSLQAPLAELQQETQRLEKGMNGTLRDVERDHILTVLQQTRGVISGAGGAAARLGLKRTTLQYKMQRLGISRMDYLD